MFDCHSYIPVSFRQSIVENSVYFAWKLTCPSFLLIQKPVIDLFFFKSSLLIKNFSSVLSLETLVATQEADKTNSVCFL